MNDTLVQRDTLTAVKKSPVLIAQQENPKTIEKKL